jgi:hypothetical protein
VDSDEFTLVPGALTVTLSGSDIQASLYGGERGYRLVGLGGAMRGTNPLEMNEATITLVYADGNEVSASLTGVAGGGVTTFAGAVPTDTAGIVEVIVTDAYGNEGRIVLGSG